MARELLPRALCPVPEDMQRLMESLDNQYSDDNMHLLSKKVDNYFIQNLSPRVGFHGTTKVVACLLKAFVTSQKPGMEAVRANIRWV
jgi:phage-related holin